MTMSLVQLLRLEKNGRPLSSAAENVRPTKPHNDLAYALQESIDTIDAALSCKICQICDI